MTTVSRQRVFGAGKMAVALALVMAAACAASTVRAGRDADLAVSGAPSLYAQLSLALESRLHTAGSGAQTLITLGAHGRDIRLSGELTDGAARRLARLLKRNPQVERIHLTSEGGLVDEAEAIGRQIAARGLVTYVPDYCVSACTLPFVRGRERLIVARARLGFHAPYELGLFGQDFRAESSAERAGYIAAGVEPNFVDTALSVSPDDIWIPDAARLIEARVATGIVDLRQLPDSTLDEAPDLAHARAAVLEGFAQVANLERTAPKTVDAIAAWYLTAYRNGVSEGDAADTIGQLAAGAEAPRPLAVSALP